MCANDAATARAVTTACDLGGDATPGPVLKSENGRGEPTLCAVRER